MRTGLRILPLLLLAAACAASASAQSPASAAQQVESLRAQLSDVQKREEELQTRMRQLDDDLRPENIERYFALNGSTRPEELREQRQRQLERQKAGVQSQLDQLAQSRTRLETSIATAEAAAYRESANPPAETSNLRPSVNVGASPRPAKATRKATRARRPRRARARRRG
jgi:cell division protein FtsB